MLEPQRRWRTWDRQAEKYCHRERPLHAPGESYHASYSAVGKAHDKGKDVTEVHRPHRTLLPDTVGSEQQKPTSLLGLANKARTNKQHRFGNLYRCLNAALLLDCWHDLNKQAASGVDNITAEVYAVNLQANIDALVQRLKAKRYRANLVRRCYIPKENGKERPLGIPMCHAYCISLLRRLGIALAAPTLMHSMCSLTQYSGLGVADQGGVCNARQKNGPMPSTW